MLVIKFLRFAVTLGVASSLGACGGGNGPGFVTGSKTNAGFAEVKGTEVRSSLSSEFNTSVSDASVGLVAFVSGIDASRGIVSAVSGIRSDYDVGNIVTSGTAVYNARYGHQIVDGVIRTTSKIGGARYVSDDRPIALTADFDAGTLTGFDSDRNSVGEGMDITVNGTISGTVLGGNVQFDRDLPKTFIPGFFNNSLPAGTVNADLVGRVGADGVIGAYVGRDTDTVVAGGFVGLP